MAESKLRRRAPSMYAILFAIIALAIAGGLMGVAAVVGLARAITVILEAGHIGRR